VTEIEGTGSRLENETVIVFNDLEADAVVDTASPAVCRRLLKLGYAAAWSNGSRARFLVPRRDVRLPRRPRAASEAQRMAAQRGASRSRAGSPERFPDRTAARA
jgi:hypothetical protein